MRLKSRAKKGKNVVIESSQSDNSRETHTESFPPIPVFEEDMGEPSKEKGEQSTQREPEKQEEVPERSEKTIAEFLTERGIDPKKIGSEKGKKRKSMSMHDLVSKKDKKSEGSSKKAKITSPESAGTSKKKKKSDLRKKKSKGNLSDIPVEWFVKKSDIPEWDEKFKSRILAYCSQIKPELYEILNTTALNNLKNSPLRKLINMGSIAYPRLTRLFYFNLSHEEVNGSMVIKSKVAGVNIEITKKVIKEVLGIKGEDKSLPERKICIDGAKELFLASKEEPGKQLTQAKLNCEGKLLFSILVRCIVPKAAKEIVTDRILELMYVIHEGYELNAASLILDHMVGSSIRTRNFSLPYGNILTLFFQYFKIPLENEESTSKGIETLDEQSLGKMGLCMTKGGDWKMFTDLTTEDKDEKEFVKPRTTIPSTASTSTGNTDLVLDKIKILEVSVDELKEEIKKLSQNMKGFKEQMDNLCLLLQELINKETAEEEESAEDSDEEESESVEEPKDDDEGEKTVESQDNIRF